MSQTITRGGPRSQIAIPAQGMIEFRDALTDLLEEFGTNDGGLVNSYYTNSNLINYSLPLLLNNIFIYSTLKKKTKLVLKVSFLKDVI